MADAVVDALARPAALCAFCPKMCRSACPTSEAEGRETVTPWGKMSLVHLGRTGAVSFQEPGVVKALEACTGCGACVEKCAHGNPVTETLFAARAISTSPRSRAFREAFEETGDVKRRDLAAAASSLPQDRNAKVAYFPGCTRLAASDDGMHRDREALERALGHAVPLTQLTRGATCCAYPLYADGQLDLVEQALLKLGEAFAGHDIVVTPDPGCAYMLTTVREALIGGGRGTQRNWPRVVPTVEVLADRAQQFAGASSGLRVRYHDLCYLGRRGRTFEAPRRLLETATGRAPLEFSQNRDAADCNGSGGLYPVSNPEGARKAAQLRASGEPGEVADVVATACPSARRGFERAGIAAVDIIDVALGRVVVPERR